MHQRLQCGSRVLKASLAALVLTTTTSAAPLQLDLGAAARLPEDTVAFLTTAPIGQWSAVYQETALYKIWKKVEPFVPKDEMEKGWSKLDADVRKELGLGLQELLAIFSGSLSIGIGDFDPEQVGQTKRVPFLARAGIGDPAGFAQLEAKLNEALTKEMGAAKLEDWDGTKVTVFQKPDKPPICYTLAGQNFYVAMDAELLKQALAGPAIKSLTRSKRFNQAVDETGREGEVLIYVDVKRLAARIKATLPTDGSKAKEWDLVGLDTMETAVLSSSVRDGRFVDQLNVRFDVPPTGMLGLLAGFDAGKADSLALIPADATIVLGLNLESFPKMLERVLQFAGKHGPPDAAAEVTEGLTQAGQQLGFDLRAELLDHLAGEIALYITLPELDPSAVQNPAILIGSLSRARAAVLVELSNPEAFEKGLGKLIALSGLTPGSVDAQGTQLKTFVLPNAPVTPVVGYSGKWLVVGLNAESFQAVVQQSSAGKPLATPLGPEVTLLLQSDPRHLFNVLGPFALVQLRQENPEIDWTKLPPIPELTASLGIDVAVLRLDRQSWRLQSVSSFGGAAVQTGIVAAIAIPSLVRSRMSANEASASGSLKTLAAAQTDYNNNSSPHSFADTLEKLRTGEGAGSVRYIDDILASGTRSGYSITMNVGSFQCPDGKPVSPAETYPTEFDCKPGEKGVCAVHGKPGAYYSFNAEAHPLVYKKTGVRSFYIDETGILLGADIEGKPGTPDMPEI